MVLGDTAGATCVWISFSGCHCCSHIELILRCICTTRPSRTWSTGVGMLTDHCWKQQHTTNTLCPTCAAFRRYVHPASCRPTMRPSLNGWNCSTVVRRGIIVPKSECCKHCSTQSTKILPAESKQDRPPEHYLISCECDKWITHYTTRHEGPRVAAHERDSNTLARLQHLKCNSRGSGGYLNLYKNGQIYKYVFRL